MAVMFPELGKTTVHIGIGNDQWIEVPMLTMKDMNDFQQILLDLVALNDSKTATNKDRLDGIMTARQKLIEIVGRVFPAAYLGRVQTLDYERLVKLVNVLCTGKDDAEKDDPQKKVEVPKDVQKT